MWRPKSEIYYKNFRVFFEKKNSIEKYQYRIFLNSPCDSIGGNLNRETYFFLLQKILSEHYPQQAV